MLNHPTSSPMMKTMLGLSAARAGTAAPVDSAPRITAVSHVARCIASSRGLLQVGADSDRCWRATSLRTQEERVPMPIEQRRCQAYGADARGLDAASREEGRCRDRGSALRRTATYRGSDGSSSDGMEFRPNSYRRRR